MSKDSSRIYVSRVIEAPLEEVWEYVRPFDEIDKWVPFLETSEIEGGKAPDQVGAIRRDRTVEGEVFREKLIELSDASYRLRYTIEEGPLPVEGYRGTLEFYPITESDHTVAEWSIQFDFSGTLSEEEQQEVKTELSGSFEDALSNLNEQLT